MPILIFCWSIQKHGLPPGGSVMQCTITYNPNDELQLVLREQEVRMSKEATVKHRYLLPAP